MQLFSRTIICFTFIFLNTGMRAQDTRFHHEIEKIIRSETKIDFDLVPTIVVLSVDQSFMSLDTFGIPLSQDQYNSNPRFWELGSLTKPFIAFLVERALLSLKLTLDSPVCEVLPDSLCHGNWKQITFRQLLEHHAGLPLITNQMAQAEKETQDPYREYSLQNLARDISEVEPFPGKYVYSHLGYGALYWLFEKVGGLTPFASQQFSEADSIHVWEDVPKELLVQGHGLNGKNATVWHANALMTAVGLKSDLPSLFHFVRKWFPDGDQPSLKSSPELVKEFDALDKKKEFKVVEGWFVFRSGKSIVYYQNGHTGGHSVSVAFIPAESKCVIVMANGEAGTQDLSLLILEMLQRGKKK